MAELTMVAALNAALRDALAGDPRTLVFGEDVGELGGVFRVTEGLQSEFGRERVFNTPIAEAGIAGICVGLAMAGWRPIAEMQFEASPTRRSTRSSATWRSTANVRAAASASRRDPDPVVRRHQGQGAPWREPRDLLRRPGWVVAVEPARRLSVAQALDRRPGPRDLPGARAATGRRRPASRPRTAPGSGEPGRSETAVPASVIAYGAMVTRCLEAVRRGLEVSVLDLRSLVPLDVEAIGEAVRATGRAVVVHEAPSRSGWAPRSWRGSSRRRSTSWRRRSRVTGRTCRTRRRRSNTDTCRASRISTAVRKVVSY